MDGKPQWEFLASMITARASHAIAILPDGSLWITGGYKDTNSGALKSTEIINLDGTISEGMVYLPYERMGHCSLTLHDGRIMIIGGMIGKTMKKNVWIFNSKNL